MIVYRQYHDGIAYDKREPFQFEYNRVKIHGLVLYTDRDPRMQPPEWDRQEHYRVGVVFDGIATFTFKLWTKSDGKQVLFNNNATERVSGSQWKHVQLQSTCGPQDYAFEHVIVGLVKHYQRNM